MPRKVIPTVSADHPLAIAARRLALLKRAADRIASRRSETVTAALQELANVDNNSVRTPYGTIGGRKGRRIVTVTDPLILARIEELQAKIDKMKENALKSGGAVESFAADTVALTGATLAD